MKGRERPTVALDEEQADPSYLKYQDDDKFRAETSKIEQAGASMSINEPATIEPAKEPVQELSFRESEKASYVQGADPFNDPSLIFDPNFADDKQYDKKEKKVEDEVAEQYVSR